MIGWVNNWQYANDIPTAPWKSAMSLPRELIVTKENSEWLLLQQPVANIEKLKGDLLVDEGVLVNDNKAYDAQSTQLEVQLNAQPAASGTCGIQLAVGGGHYAEIGYDATAQKLYVDRSHTANQSFNKNFEKLNHYETPLALKNNTLKLHIFFDNSIIEVFANDGEAVMTMQVFPDLIDNGVALFSNGGTTTFGDVKIWKMNSAWE
jgi:fructan beta-fructosidase